MDTTPEAIVLAAMGRATVDLPGRQLDTRPKDAASLDLSPADIAFGMARPGPRSALPTRVGDDRFGRFIRGRLPEARRGIEIASATAKT